MATTAEGMIEQQQPTAGGAARVARKLWLAALGIIPTVGESGSHLFETLVENGERFEKEHMTPASEEMGGALNSAKTSVGETVREVRGKFSGLRDKGRGLLDETVSAALKRHGMPTREEFDSLMGRLDGLSAKLEELSGKMGSPDPQAETSAGRQ